MYIVTYLQNYKKNYKIGQTPKDKHILCQFKRTFLYTNEENQKKK